MNKILKDYFGSISVSEVTSYGNMSVQPLFVSRDKKKRVNYITLKQAMDKRKIRVKEISKEGNVPELSVENTGDENILLLDGEELRGAKQNRVLNTSILVKSRSKIIIPVSCTERGRWEYEAPEFSDSEAIMESRARRRKARTVSSNLKNYNSFRSDQQAVWNDIDDCLNYLNVDSHTSAMRDALMHRKEDIDKYLEEFTLKKNQQGILVFIGGDVAGMDILSSKDAYRDLHNKLIKSYALEAIVSEKTNKRATRNKSKRFRKDILKCSEEIYDSPGLGRDHRYESDDIVGSSLIYNDVVIHCAFFRVEKSEKTGNISDMKRRRYYRI
ncbi:MAG: ARPP-1 family domain-containing protein [Atribacterota bacterium]